MLLPDKEHYFSGDWQVVRGEEGRIMDLADEEVRQGKDPAEHPGSCSSPVQPASLSALWEKAKPDVIFKDRGGEG